MLSWKLHYGNRGFVFSLDITIAVVIVILILLSANQYLNKGDDDSLARLQMVKIGGDIMAILDYQDILDGLNSGVIQSEKNNLLPVNYQMRIKIDCGNVDTLEEIPIKTNVGGGKRSFVVNGNNFCTGRFWIWLE